MGSPSTKTVQAPQSPALHPIFTSRAPKSSRNTPDSRAPVSGYDVAVFPFNVNEIADVKARSSMFASPPNGSSALFQNDI
jgi:hypothetical protein